MQVNWCEVTISDPRQGKQLYYNAFATDHEIAQHNVSEVAAAGRARWKIE